MELNGKLKKDAEKVENKEEAKKVVKNAGAEDGVTLSDDELDKVAGGRRRKF